MTSNLEFLEALFSMKITFSIKLNLARQIHKKDSEKDLPR